MSRLDEIEARASAATPGPWSIRTNEKNCLIISSRQTQGWVCVGDPDAAPEAQEDAEFIANAPTDLTDITNTLRAITKIHKRIQYGMEASVKHGWVPEFVCEHCATPDGGGVPWPCETAAALEKLEKS